MEYPSLLKKMVNCRTCDYKGCKCRYETLNYFHLIRKQLKTCVKQAIVPIVCVICGLNKCSIFSFLYTLKKKAFVKLVITKH